MTTVQAEKVARRSRWVDGPAPGVEGTPPESSEQRGRNGHPGPRPRASDPRGPDELRLKGVQVSAGGVRGVHGLNTNHERLPGLEETAEKCKLKLTDEQIRALERFDPAFRERHIEVWTSPGHEAV